MGQRLNRSKLFFGQLAGGQKPSDYQSTISGFYGGVGKGQTEAVQKLGEDTEKETRNLSTNLGLTQEVDTTDPTKIKTSLKKDSPFSVTATPGGAPPPSPPAAGTPAGTQPAAAPAPGAQPPTAPGQVTVRDKNAGESEEDYLKYLSDTLTSAGSSVEAWKKSGKDAETYINDLLKQKRDEADKARATAEGRLTEGKLGQRREASELEKQAQSYQNVLAAEPGTSNIKALAMLSQFYDPKYLTLESGLRQGEMSLARQEAVGNVGAMQQAEAQRGTAISEYGKQSKQLGQELMNQIGAQEEAKRKEFKDFYSKGLETAESAKGKAEGKITETQKAIEKRDMEAFNTEYNRLKGDNALQSLDNVLNALGGRAGNNWLRNRGSEVLNPLRTELANLTDQIDVIRDNTLISAAERTKRIKDLKTKIDNVKTRSAGELAAFLGDKNTQPGDALDAAEQIMAAGLINFLSDDQKRVIRDRIRKDKHIVTNDKNRMSSPEKLQRVYNAFGGTENLIGEAAQVKAIQQQEKDERTRSSWGIQ